MDVQELVNIFRQRSDDGVFPYHVSDDEAIRFAAEAEEEACIRAKLIYDQESDMCTLSMLNGMNRYGIDPAIFHIEQARYISAQGAVSEVCIVGTDMVSGFNTSTSGRPYKLAHSDDFTVTVWPTPNVYNTGDIKLSVRRTPLFPVEELDDEFEIHPRHHQYLVDWMLYRAYGSKDSELRDDVRSAAALRDFEARFGVRRPADIMRRHAERREPVVKPERW